MTKSVSRTAWHVHMPALRIVLIYLVFGFVWIGASDHLALYLTRGLDPAWYARVQLFKGIFFVAVTAILLYLALVRAYRGRLAEQRLAQSERNFELLVNSILDYAIYLLDRDGRVASWNLGAERIMGYREQEVLGRDFSLFFSPEDRRDGKPEQILATALREGHCEDSGTRSRKDGSQFWADVVITPLHDSRHHHTGFVEVTRDVTDRKLLRDSMESFNYSVSHDLRAPLRAINGFTDILVEQHARELDEEGRHYLERVADAGARMERMLESLLAYSRLSPSEISLRPVSLEALMERLLSEYEPRLREEGASLEVRGELPYVQGDTTLLEQIITNLVDNALTYRRGDEPARVEVTCRADGDAYLLCVQDNGIGIRQENIDAIFGLFRRLHGQGEYAGTGVGLAVVARSAELLGGRVWVESEPGRGSRFFVRLPRPQPQPLYRAGAS